MTRDDIEFDVSFGYWYNFLNEKFYSRWDLVFNLVQLIGGSAAAAGVMAGSSALVAASGVALAVCAALSLAWQPGIKAERHCNAKKDFLDLKGCMLSLSDAELAKECAALQKGEASMPSLNVPALNMTRRALGDAYDFKAMTGWQRFVMRLSS